MDNLYLYLDESGDGGWPESVGGNSPMQHFVYAGVILTPRQNYRAKERLTEVLTQHFTDRGVKRPSEVHYADSVHGNGQFSQLGKDERREFNEDILDLILELDPTLMATVVDKKLMKERYKHNANPPKRYAFRATVDRFHKHLVANDSVGVITIDSAEPRFDKRLRELVYSAQSDGIKLPGASDDSNTTLPRLMDTITMTPSEMSVGIQLSDVVAYQVQHEYRYSGTSYAFEKLRDMFRDPDGHPLTEPSEIPRDK